MSGMGFGLVEGEVKFRDVEGEMASSGPIKIHMNKSHY